MTACALALLLTACATASQHDQMAWVRADGQSINSNPALLQKYQLDHTVCEGEMQNASLAGQAYCPGGAIACAVDDVERRQSMPAVGKDCMADRGYTEVPVTAPNGAGGVPVGTR
jgi:hypothetical protein